MVVIKGFIGRVYFLFDENWQGDIWESQVWPTPKQVLDEMVDQKKAVLEAMICHSEMFSENTKRANNVRFNNMIAELRAAMTAKGVEDSFEDIVIKVASTKVHLPHVTEYEWSRICGEDAAS